MDFKKSFKTLFVKFKSRTETINDKADSLVNNIYEDMENFKPIEQAEILNLMRSKFKERKTQDRRSLIRSKEEITEALKLLK